MSRFRLIDNKLAEIAKKLNARLTKDRPGYPEALRTFEERRIDWEEHKIHKAIIIQPNFEASGVNSTSWNFINIAWFDDARSMERPQWMEVLLQEGTFEKIEINIDDLLRRSEWNLGKIRMEDLR